jgi:hypothetical protein
MRLGALGVRIGRLRWMALAAASLVTAAAVAISGPIAFVGFICPHVARRLVGPDQRRLLPIATAAGAILLCRGGRGESRAGATGSARLAASGRHSHRTSGRAVFPLAADGRGTQMTLAAQS